MRRPLAKVIVGVLCLSAASTAVPVWSQTAAAANSTSGQASAAAALISKQYIVNQDVNVDGTKKPLPKNGSFGVRPAQAAERVAACDAEGATCLEVLYRAGQPEIACGWTVLFPAGGGAPKVVNENDASAQYMLRHFGVDDPDKPKRLVGQMPITEGFVRIMNMTGTIVVRAVVEPDGKVLGTGVINATNPLMNHNVVEAVNRWQMETFTLNGKALPYEELISFHVSPQLLRYVSP